MCREALQYRVRQRLRQSVLDAAGCEGTGWVDASKHASVIGFPLGATLTEAKVAETEAALRAGAQEIDMVLNIGALRDGDHATVRDDIRAVVAACHRAGASDQSDSGDRAAGRRSEDGLPACLQKKPARILSRLQQVSVRLARPCRM